MTYTIGLKVDSADPSLFDFMDASLAQDILTGNNGSTDFSPHLQALVDACLAEGRTGFLPATPTPLRIESPVSAISTAEYQQGLRLVGAGQFATVFDSRVTSDAMLTIDASATDEAYSAQFNVQLENFAITTAGSADDGVKFIACWNTIVDALRVEGLMGKGLIFDVQAESNLDADVAAFSRIANCRLKNLGYGIYASPATSGFLAMVQSEIWGNYIAGCAYDGICMAGVDGIDLFLNAIINCGAAETNSYGGIYVAYNGIHSRNLRIRGNELGNGNRAYNIKVDALVNGCFAFNRHVENDGDPKVIQRSILLGNGSQTIRNIDIAHEQLQVGECVSPYTLLDIASNVSPADNVNLFSPDKLAWDGGTKTLCNAPSRLRVFEEDGMRYREPARRRMPANISSGGTYSPDLNNAAFHEILVTTASAVTIAAPSVGVGNVRDGEILELHITNGTGGAVSISLAAGYLTAGFVSPAAGKRRTCRFSYSAGEAKWIQCGAWSPDL